MDARDDYDEIVEIIKEQVEYLRHYTGIVTNRRLVSVGAKGRQFVQVKATVSELGLITDDLAIWCNPRDGRSMIVPNVDDYVEIYFINGDSSRPVYLYPVSEIPDHGFDNADLEKDIIYQDIDNSIHITFDRSGNKLEIGNSDLKEAARVDDQAESSISIDSTFWTWINAVHAALQSSPANGIVGATLPTKAVSAITEGSDQVFIGGK